MNIRLCPHCKGNKATQVDNSHAKCLYCGTVYELEDNSQPKYEPKSVKNEVPPQPAPTIIYTSPQPQYYPRHSKSKVTALLLTFFLGFLGIQWFYLNKTWLGVLSLLFCWTWIPSIIAFIQFFYLLFISEDTFDYMYNS